MKYLGIDWGEKKIGLAIGDDELNIATPLTVVGNIDEVLEIIKKDSIDKIILGLPNKLDNKKSETYNKVIIFKKELEEKLSSPIETIDERLSSKAADALDGSIKTKADQDAIAAMLILQTYLDQVIL